MGEPDIEDAIEEQLKDEITLTEDEFKSPPDCRHCNRELDYETFNETSPQTDYIVHVIPGADQHTPSKRVKYCDVSCFVSEMRQYEG